MIPLLWLIAGVLLIAVELMSGTLVLLMLGVASLVAAGASALGAPWGPTSRSSGSPPPSSSCSRARRCCAASTDRARTAPPTPGRRRCSGRWPRSIEPITGDDAGTVRIGGALWTARALHEGAALATGDPVVVVDIRGATAVVTADVAGPAHPSRPPLQGES